MNGHYRQGYCEYDKIEFVAMSRLADAWYCPAKVRLDHVAGYSVD